MENKILTLIVPIYNKEKLLEQCLDSLIIKSDISLLEVLMIDDGSTDSSYRIMCQYAQKYPNSFIPVKKENGGVGSVMNLGIKMASGKYIKEVDADDWLDTSALENLIDVLKNCEVDMVLNPFREVNQYGERIGEKFFRGYYFNQTYLIESVIGKVLSSIQGITIKRELLIQNKFVISNDRYYIDMQLVDSCVMYAKTCMLLSDSLYRYRKNQEEQSVSLSSYVKNVKSFENQTYLSLDRLQYVRNREYKNKERYFFNCAYGYSIYLLAIYWLSTDNSKAKWKQYNKYLYEKYPDIYKELDKTRFIRVMRRLEVLPEKIMRSYFQMRMNRVRKENAGIEMAREM